MKRLRFSIFVLLLALSMPSASLLGSRCGSDCPDERASGSCLPGCRDCVCCPAARVVLTPVTMPLPIPRVTGFAADPLRPPAAPEPAEITHVPKRVTA